jgi:PPE family
MLGNFSVLPPEINSLLMFSGAGAAPMIEAATAGTGWPPTWPRRRRRSAQ